MLESNRTLAIDADQGGGDRPPTLSFLQERREASIELRAPEDLSGRFPRVTIAGNRSAPL